MMRSLLTLFVVLAIATGCDRNADIADAPRLPGTWAGVVGGDSLVLNLDGSPTSVIGLADWGDDQYTVTGSAEHPEVSLRMTGPFAADRVVTFQGQFRDADTLEGMLGTAGFPDQPVTFQRRAPTAPR
jgi:hypothetical protein